MEEIIIKTQLEYDDLVDKFIESKRDRFPRVGIRILLENPMDKISIHRHHESFIMSVEGQGRIHFNTAWRISVLGSIYCSADNGYIVIKGQRVGCDAFNKTILSICPDSDSNILACNDVVVFAQGKGEITACGKSVVYARGLQTIMCRQSATVHMISPKSTVQSSIKNKWFGSCFDYRRNPNQLPLEGNVKYIVKNPYHHPPTIHYNGYI